MGLDGEVGRSSWPLGFKFPKCLPVEGGGESLPGTDGNTHVAFAIRAVKTIHLTDLVVDYARADTFLEVRPPADVPTDLQVVVTPGTGTVGAMPFIVPGYNPAPKASLEIRQDGRAIHGDEACGFETELDHCVGPVRPHQPVEIILRDHGTDEGQLALSLAWG